MNNNIAKDIKQIQNYLRSINVGNIGDIASVSARGKSLHIRNYAGNELRNVPVVGPYGLASSGTDGLLAQVLHNDNDTYSVLGVIDTGRPDVAPGEVVLYSTFGQRILFGKDGDIKFKRSIDADYMSIDDLGVDLDADLVAIAALTGTGSLKRTGDNTWALDTSEYAPLDHIHSYQPADEDLLAIGGLPDGATGLLKKIGTNTWTLDTNSYQLVDADLTAIAALAGTSGLLRKTAADTWELDTTGYQTLNTDLTAIAALVGTSGLLRKTAADTWELDTNQYQQYDADLAAIAALTGASGLLKKTSADTWALDTTEYLSTSAKASDSAKLGGQLPSYYMLASNSSKFRSIICGSSFAANTVGNGQVKYFSFGQGSAYEPSFVMPCAGTIKNLHVYTSTTAGTGQVIYFDLFKNGVATGVGCAIGASTNVAADTTNTASVVAGDRVVLRAAATASATANAVNFAFEFDPS